VVDTRLMDVIGYDLSAPEPALWIPVAGVLAGIMVRRRRRTV